MGRTLLGRIAEDAEKDRLELHQKNWAAEGEGIWEVRLTL
jgi:hypothetical protein